MSMRRIGGGVLISVVLLVGGCGGDGATEASEAPAATGFAAAAAAARAEEQTKLRAAGGPKGFGSASASDRSDRNSLRGNTPPTVAQVEVVRAEVDARDSSDVEMWQAIAEGRDAEGDSLRFSYRWILNGERTDEDDESYPAGKLVRGDRLQVEVTAHDGQATSAALRSGTITIGNGAPQIVSKPPRPDALGNFRYQVRVEDPDGDREFAYLLDQAPDGMTIDGRTGLIVWKPTLDQAGSHEVAVAVSDEGGASATQSFRLALIKRVEDSPPAAAR